MKLLIADDNPSIRELLRSMCGHLFEDILECEDGDEAISLCSSENPDWVLMDIQMKRTDGLTATKKIKEERPEIRVVIVSQFTDKSFIEEAFKAGATDFVSKADLTRLEEILDNENSR
jgi:CheY-like chemotaxis protein